MAGSDCDWKKSVQKKLISVFGSDAETLTRILFYLDEEDKAYKDSDSTPPVWKTLKMTIPKDNVFQKYAERLAEDTKRAEKDEAFRKTMNLLYDQMMEPVDTPAPHDHGQEFDIIRLADLNIAEKSAFIGLARAWNMIPKPTQAFILEAIPKIISNKQLVSCVDEVVGLVNKAGGSVVMIGLAALQLGYDAINNLRRWWRGEISGIRCAKNIIDSFCTVAAGVGGGVVGAAVGSLAGPIGTFVGGVAGSFASSAAMNVLSDRVTQWLFGVPKSEALENAYNYLGVSMTASNNEINSAFHKLCLKHHPDKPGGSTEEFLILQLNMGTIKAARGEL